MSESRMNEAAYFSPASSSRTELGMDSCRVEDGDSLPVC